MRFIGAAVLALVSAIGFAQTRSITGRIVDEENQKGVPGATVTIADTDKHAVTNQLGYFALEVGPMDKHLVIVSLGYIDGKVDVPPTAAFKAGVQRDYLLLEPLDLGYFSAEALDPPDTLEAPSFEEPETDAVYPGGWRYVYNDLARALGIDRHNHLFTDAAQRVQFTVLPNGTIGGVRSPGASDSVKTVVEAAFKTLKPWTPARQNQFSVAQHFELPLSWTKDVIYTVVEQSATPVGGIQTFYNTIGKAIKYPAQARRMGVEGNVMVEFLIQTDGSITDAKVVKGIGGGCDEEALRVLSLIPKWNPGTQKGRPVRQRYTLPIMFRLDGPDMSRRSIEKSFNPDPKSYGQWLSQNIRYPATARRAGVDGLVVVCFRVRAIGRIDSIRVVQDIGGGCGEEIVRALGTVPGHLAMPLTKTTSPIMYQPIQFHLGSDKDPRPKKADLSKWNWPNITLLPTIEVTAIGVERSYRSTGLTQPVPGGTFIIKNYKSFEEALVRPRAIEELSLVGNFVTVVPPDINKFKSLKFLDLENNQVKSLPPEFGTLTRLIQFYAPLNQLKDLPIEFVNLKSLRVLALGGNQFEQFPTPVLTLTKLTALDLSGNQISTLPVAIGEMHNLQTLFLQDNKITTLPEEFYQLTQLKVLSIGGNPISEQDKKRIKATFKKTDVKFD